MKPWREWGKEGGEGMEGYRYFNMRSQEHVWREDTENRRVYKACDLV